MREPLFVKVATWMVERGIPQPMGEVVAGDLLEELGAGRSAGWFWRQVLVALGQSAASRLRPYAGAMGFSVVWTALFPCCFAGVWSAFLTGELLRWSALDWPYSSLLLVTGGLLPATVSILLGLLVYVFLLVDARPSGVRLLGSFSLSLNALCVMRVCVSVFGGVAVGGPHLEVQQVAFLGAEQPVWSGSLALALWVAIACVLRSPRAAVRRSSSPA